MWLILIVLMNGSSSRAAILNLPTDAGAPPASSSIVPLLIDDARGILGADIRIEYDSSVALATAVSKTPLSSQHTLTANLLTPGIIIISLFGASPLSGSGPLIDITFDSVGTLNTETILDIVSADLNEGIIEAQLTDGKYCVQGTPNEIQSLKVDVAAPGSSVALLSWKDDPSAASYNVYRATLIGSTAAGTDGVCGSNADGEDGLCGGAAGNDEICGTTDDNPQLFGPDGVCGPNAAGADGFCGAAGPDGVCGGASGVDGICGTADDNAALFGPDGVCGASGPDGLPCNGDEDPADFGPDGICGTADDISDDLPGDDDESLFGPDGICGTADDIPAADDNPDQFGPDGICGTADDISDDTPSDDNTNQFGPDGICGTADDTTDDNPTLFGPDGLCGTADDISSDLSCFRSGLTDPTVNDGDLPTLTGIFFYLVTAKNCRKESTLGFASDGFERLSLDLCP